MGVPFANSEEVCCLSSFFLCWVHPLLRAGWKGEMQAEVRARRSGPPPFCSRPLSVARSSRPLDPTVLLPTLLH